MKAVKLVSKDGDMLPMLSRLEAEGRDVSVWVQHESDIYSGMIHKVDSAIELDINDNDIVLFDMVGAGEAADTLKRKGYYVIGGGSFNDAIELDRFFGSSIMKEAGIRTPPSFLFHSFEELEAFLRENPGEDYVFKPHGNLDTDLTLAGYSSEYLLRMIPYLDKRCPDGTQFEIQEFMSGVEVSTEGWFNGKEFCRPFNSTMEEKKMMEGNKGPASGCAGNATWWWDNETSEILYQYLFKGLEPILRENNYLGPIDINGIWAHDGIYALEFTARFGYDAIQASSRLFTEPFGDVLESLPSLRQLPVRQNVMAFAVRVSIPPYPLGGDVPNVPIEIHDYEDIQGNIYLSDVMVGPDGGLQCAGVDGYVLCVAEHGLPVESLESLCVATIDEKVVIPSMQYRRDTASRVVDDKQQFQRILKQVSRRSG